MTDEGFRVDSPEKAALVMRKLRRLAQKQKQNEELAQAEADRIQMWLTRTNAPIESQIEWLSGHLEAYALQERLTGNKSVDLPDGSIKTRNSGGTFEVDKPVFVEWAQEAKREDLLRVSYAPNMTAIKTSVIADAHVALDPASGEVIPGLIPVPDRVSVTITPDLTAVDLEGIEDLEIDDVE